MDSSPSAIEISLKMNEMREILIDPRFPIDERDIKDFLGEFGPFNGKYIARYPFDWKKRLLIHINDLDLKPVSRQAILARICSEADLCSVPVPWRWEAEHAWAKNVEGIIGSHSNSIVVGDALDPSPFVSWCDALDDIRDSRRRSWPFDGSVSAYRDACLPLLLNATSAYLIDPYLDPFSNMVEHLIKSLLERTKGSPCYALDLITTLEGCGSSIRPKGDSTRITDCEIDKLFRQSYVDLVPKDRILRLHIVWQFGNVGEIDMHDRFFLTKHGSISFGRGYMFATAEAAKAKPINAFITDKVHHLLLKRTYIDGVARHSEHLPKVAGIAYPNRVTTFTIQPATN